MARIVYGVSGEGSGHSSRSRSVLTHLVGAGHEVRVVSYDRGVRNLSGDFPVFEVEGLGIATRENRVSVVRTFTENLAKLPGGVRSARSVRAEVFDAFEPHVVFTDFEPVTAYLADLLGLPLVTIDNQHRMRYLRLPRPPGKDADARLTDAIVRMIVPRPSLSLVTSFVDGERKNDRTVVFPPILRAAVLAAEAVPAEPDSPVLVYLTNGFDALVDQLADFPRERFLVYGTAREGVDGNRTFLPPSRDGFLADLCRAKAVVSTAGFTLMTESLHLGKPFLAIPMRGQYEQELNAHLLEHLAYGRSAASPSREAVGEFLYRIPELAERLRSYPRAGNERLFTFLDELLADEAAEARRWYERRRAE